jgi:hypothetical protein
MAVLHPPVLGEFLLENSSTIGVKVSASRSPQDRVST